MKSYPTFILKTIDMTTQDSAKLSLNIADSSIYACKAEKQKELHLRILFLTDAIFQTLNFFECTFIRCEFKNCKIFGCNFSENRLHNIKAFTDTNASYTCFSMASIENVFIPENDAEQQLF